MSESSTTWLAIGFLGQGIFTARFLVQWAASEKKRDSVIPVAFWWLSLCGGAVLLAYASYKRDKVFMVGQSLGVFIYVRNLMLVKKSRRRAARSHEATESGDNRVTLHGPHPSRDKRAGKLA